ncbi:MAG: porphobilinogen deaminase [Verrucomicrobia bacterium]|nr:porphobilinogen deaminase [Verrucomicrobiota bacterium]
MSKIVLATRKSPLALVQAEMVASCLREAMQVEAELLRIVTTGDKQAEWSLETKGGKGLFTSELEQAVLRGEADLAVHSSKDLPGEMPSGLAIAGYLPRADTRDVLVVRAGTVAPRSVATGSPRRRLQVARLFPSVTFTEIRGNVDTRLRKIAEQGVADGTVLAAAGLKRLGIERWDGLEFRPLSFTEMVPAVGQGAIAVQCRASDRAKFAGVFDAETARALGIERALQTALGGGCHTAFGAHVAGNMLYFFHEQAGVQTLPLNDSDFENPAATADRILKTLGLK